MSRIAALSAAAPLMSIPESRVPEGGTGEWFRGAGGLRLRLGWWPCKNPPRGTVFISPGRSEPIEKYYEVIRDLLSRDFCVVAHDWRGQGLSARLLTDRLKCHARSADEFLDDYQRLLDSFEDRAPKPWIMLGHSMGAALNLMTLVKGEPRIAGALFTNPMLRMKTGKHSLWSVNFQTNWQVNHGRGTDYIPEIFDDPFEHTFENDALTHDAARYELWREQLFACPHLAVGSPTWGWLSFALKVGETLLKDKNKVAKKVRAPIIILVSSDDRLINKAFAKPFAKKLGKATCIEIAGAEHEILIEADAFRSEAFAEFDSLAETVAPRALAGQKWDFAQTSEDDDTSETEAEVAEATEPEMPAEDGVEGDGLPEDEPADISTEDQKSA